MCRQQVAPPVALPCRHAAVAGIQFRQRTMQPPQVGLLPRRPGWQDGTAVEVDQRDAACLVQQNVVRIEIGVKHSQGMKAADAFADAAGQIHVGQAGLQIGGQGPAARHLAGEEVGTIVQPVTLPPAAEGLGHGQTGLEQLFQQAVLDDAAHAGLSRPQIAIAKQARHAATASIVAQYGRANRGGHHKNTTATTGHPDQHPAPAPEGGIKPERIQPRGAHRVMYHTLSVVRYDALIRHQPFPLAMQPTDIHHHAGSLPRAPASVCLLRTSALGDVTHVVPLVRDLQCALPDTRLTWIVGKPERRLVGDMGGVEFITFDKARGMAAWREVRAALAGRRFDALLHMQVALRSNLLSLAVRAHRRIGYDRARARDLHGLFVNERIEAVHGQHVLDAIGSFALALGVQRRQVRWDIPVPDDDRAWAARQWPDDGQPTLLINPCASHPLRNWHAAGYAAVADHAARVLDMRVVLSGGPSAAERAAGDAIQSATRSPVLDLIGRDTLKRALALYQRASIVLTPDSGPMHMANAMGTPVLGLHAASNPDRSGPYSDRRWCVNRYDDAARKYLRKPASALPWGTKIERPGVMDLVTVDDVLERLEAFLQAQ